MVKFSLKFWLLGYWVAGSFIFINIATEKADISLMLAAIVNLIICTSVVKSRKDIFEEALKKLP